MSRARAFLLCAVPALFPIPPANGGESEPALTGLAPDAAHERGVPALFSWGDVDGDGRLDLAAVNVDGTFQLLVSASEGRFEDATERFGLAEVGEAALALWADYDADGRLDLFVGARAGASRLLRNEGGFFSDMSAASGLSSAGPVQSAHWLDHDGDGRLDLFVVTGEGNTLSTQLFRGLEGGFFERAELPLAEPAQTPGLGGSPPAKVVATKEARPPAPATPSSQSGGRIPTDHPTGARTRVDGGRLAAGSPPTGTSALQLGPACASALADQATAGACVRASTTPTLGRLYPLSTNLFVAVDGNVGIGTTSPTAKLHVAGTARMSDKLTLAPSGDTALDVSTGSIYKAGALFIHTKGSATNTALGTKALGKVTSGLQNTAGGNEALANDTTGARNTASGHQALFTNTSGDDNTASGAAALRSNTSGKNNTASGSQALFANTTGEGNSASGAFALFSNTSGAFNTASGYAALYSNTIGESNTAVGDSALIYNTTGSANSASGARGLAHNTTGNFNTASGYAALFANTTGSSNTASGASGLTSNTTGSFNTALGDSALYSNTVGNGNTASGAGVLAHNTSGNYNTASGDSALYNNTSGSNNSASGFQALASNTTGSGNTASGRKALFSNTTGSHNTASGNAALHYNTTGSFNIAIGAAAGLYQTTGSGNIAIGSYGTAGDTATTRIGTAQTRTFIAGIRGATTGVANAIPILIDSAGQLGTTFSSRRFKQDIRDMGDATARLFELRPVLFRYKEVQTLPGGQPIPPEYGLIAEEVAEILPDLVVYDDEGEPLTVKYHVLSTMLLNELKRLREQTEEREGDLRRELDDLRARLATLEERRPTAALPATR
jgi:hypothetical protein